MHTGSKHCVSALALAGAWALAGCVLSAGGGDDESDETPPTTVASPPGGVFRAATDVMLVTDEPSTVYYTTDGTPATTSSPSAPSPVMLDAVGDAEIHFFAVDLAGNVGASGVASYVVERLGPPPLLDFTAVADGEDVSLSWSNPTAPGFLEVVVARTDDVAASVAADGAPLASGDSAGSADVIFVGAESGFTDPAPGPGGHTYVAWARYDNDAYSDARVAAVALQAAPTGKVVVDVGAGLVTPSSPLADFTVSGDNVVFDEATSTVSFDITLASGLAGVIFNPKLVVTALTAGTFSDPDCSIAAGAAVGEPCRYFGPAGMTAGAPITRAMSVSGVTAASVFTIDVAFQHDRGVFAPTWSSDDVGGVLVDPGSAAGYDALPPSPGFDNSLKDTEAKGYRGGVVSLDGRYLFAGTRNAPQVVKVELTAMSAVGGATLALTRDTGAVSDLRLDPSGRRLYALLNDGMHNGASRASAADYASEARARAIEDNSVILVEIDAATMTETGRVALGSGDAAYRGRRMALSADGRWAAAAAGAQYADPSISDIYVVDLAAMAVRDADPDTAGVQGIPAAPMRPSQVEFSSDGAYLVCNNSWQADSSHVGVVDLSATALSVQPHDLTGAISKAMTFVPRQDGTIWVVGDGSGLTTLDPADGAFSKVGTEYVYARAAMVDSDGSALVLVSTRLLRYEAGDGAATELATWTTSTYGHSIALTPY